MRVSYAQSIQLPDAEIEVSHCDLDGSVCAKYIMEAYALKQFDHHKVYNTEGKTVVDKKNRGSVTIIPKHEEELAYFMYEAVEKYAQKNFAMKSNDELVMINNDFFAYPPGMGLTLHTDDFVANGQFSIENFNRGITAILYLPSDFTGGEMYFPKQKFEIKPSAGTLLIFPGNRNFPHGVREITGGFRFSYQRMYGIINGDTNGY